MKTIFKFTEGIDKRKVTLIHSKKIKIFEEIREDHQKWFDKDNNLIKERSYIVIHIPKSIKIQLNEINMNYNKLMTTGYKVNEFDNHLEILIYNQVTFTWIFYELEDAGIFKIVQRMIPDFNKFGEIFHLYINPKGLHQWIYNIFGAIVQIPFENYKEKKLEQEMIQNKNKAS